MSDRVLGIMADSFTSILIPGLTATAPLAVISFSIVLVIATATALVQYARIPVLTQIARFYIWIVRGTPLLVQLYVVFYGLPDLGIMLDPFPAAIIVFSLNTGAYSADTMANGVSVTDEREEKYDFTEPYAFNNIVVIVRGDNDEIASLEDLEGKTTANTLASSYAALAESYGATCTGVDDFNATIELLDAGRIDATLNDEVVFNDYMAQHPDANLKVAAMAPEPTHIAYPLRREEATESLREAMNEAIDALRADGTLAQISNAYFGMDITAA